MAKNKQLKRQRSGAAQAATSKGEATRELLCTSILELVTEQGYAGFRLRDLCERTGLTIGAFYFHFENKEQALEFVAARAAHDLFHGIAAAIQGKPLIDAFRATIQSFQRGYSDIRLREQTRFMSSMIPANASVSAVYFEERAAVIDALVSAARAERQHAGLRAGPERATIEYLFSGLADFFTMLYLHNDAALKKSAGSTTTLADRMARLWYDAVLVA